MNPKKIKILEELLQALEEKSFDLNAWKIKAILIISKIFGKNDPKVNLIESLHYDYSSWALRDHSGGKIHDSVKDKAKEMIEAAILELKLEEEENPVMQIISEELTGSEYSSLQELLSASPNKKTSLTKFLKELPEGKTEDILSSILIKLNA